MFRQTQKAAGALRNSARSVANNVDFPGSIRPTNVANTVDQGAKPYSAAAVGEPKTDIELSQYNYDTMSRALGPVETPQPYVRTIAPCEHQPEVPMDGCQAAAYVAYSMSETSFIYPISPATTMGEHMDNWASLGRKNALGQVVRVTTMQSEGGAAGAVHGSVAVGSLASTFTASQGLLLMIPNLYLMAGELMPVVLHVSARTVAKHALSIFNDHSDVMACRQTGFAFLCSNSVQEVIDLGLVAHIATIRSRVPFLHFFDGFRTSHEIAKVKTIPYNDVERLVPYAELQRNLRDLALNPQHPIIRGTGQRPDIFFQSTVAAQRFYDAAPGVVQAVMDEVGQLTGRQHYLFEYCGSSTAEDVVVMMGSAAETAEGVVEFMNASCNENVGVVKVRLFRPWSLEHFIASLPKSTKRITVLDRTREDGAQGNPLFLDVVSSIMESDLTCQVIGGTYGLASKEFTPGQLKAVYDNMRKAEPKKRFVVGVEDDVTHSSLVVDESFDTDLEGTTQCMFWGLGGDGTIGANKASIKNLALDGGLEAQAYFSYDSHKEMGCTTSHLRFGKNPILAHYVINNNAQYIACHHPSYVRKFDIIAAIKDHGICVVNCPWATVAEIEDKFPNRLKRQIAQRHVKLVTIDATKVAMDLGLGMRINTIMQSCFYQLSGVLPVDQALHLLRTSIEEVYAKKGPEVISANLKAVDAASSSMVEIDYPAEAWAALELNDAFSRGRQLTHHTQIPDPVNAIIDGFVKKIMDPVLMLEGDSLPVSTFVPGGFMASGTCMHEERGLAAQVPVWEPDKCTQCNYCVIVCPHSVIRPFLLDRNEAKAAPDGFEVRKATGGAEYAGFNFTIQLATEDCTGCAICVQSCPDDALHMEPYQSVSKRFKHHWDYAINLPQRNPADKMTVKGSQFQQPLLEFSGACPGCGETPYVSLATRLFGDRMVIANASGCSSVWGGTATTNPYTVNEKGFGPAWGRSLFEDNAEYGFGMAMGAQQRRFKVKGDVESALKECEMPKTLKSSFEGWLANYNDYDKSDKFVKWIEGELPAVAETYPLLTRIHEAMDHLRPQSHWIIGGDGWAYDIGFGGVDHVLSKGENVNIMVLDTEMYSNTGGQASKSTQKSTVLKFAQSGKAEMKKDLGAMAMAYGNIYVASVAMGANYNQCVQALREAESYNGTSLMLCYSPCIDWGIDMQYQMEGQRVAVQSGYWKLYRFDPRLAAEGKQALQLDSLKIKSDVKKFLETQNRFKQLMRKDSEKAARYFGDLETALGESHEGLVRRSLDDIELLDHLKGLVGESVSGERALVLYASETGTANMVAKMLQAELLRRGVRAKCLAMDDYDFDNLPSEGKVLMIGATCGQGEFPDNSKGFWKALQNPSLPSDWLENTNYAMFAMGDTAYVYYNKVGKDIDMRMAELGAKRMVALGNANEKDDEKWETAWSDWIPEVYNEMGTQEPEMSMPAPTFKVETKEDGSPDSDIVVPMGAKLVPLNKVDILHPPGHDRDIRHFEFGLENTSVLYNCGDSLGVYPWNPKAEVLEFLEWYGLAPSTVLEIKGGGDGAMNGVMTALQLFEQVLDVLGRPNRRFYEMCMLNATDPKEASEIKYIMSKEGKDAFKELLKETPTFFDIMQKWPSTKLSLDYLMEFLPPIKPRLYSIASSPEADGDNLQLCIVAEDWTTPSGRYRHGLTTGYLRYLEPQDDAPIPVAARVNAASFSLPATNQQPAIMVALGTGIAPCRAVIRERLHARDHLGVTDIGPMALFFGIRFRASEYSYGESEWEPLHDGGKGPLTILANAFSRDQKEKIYVQHRMDEHSETIYDWIVKQNGYYLLCGPSGPPCAASRQSVVNAIAIHGAKDGFTPESAEQYVTDMQISGRFNEEVW